MVKLALITILFVLAAAISRMGGSDQKPRTEELSGISRRNKRFILNGEDAVAHEFPWIVYIVAEFGNYGSIPCCGSLISPRIVLTTAECLRYTTNATKATVYYGWHRYPPKVIKSGIQQEKGLVSTTTEFAFPPLPKPFTNPGYYSYGVVILSKPISKSKTVDFIPFANSKSPAEKLQCYTAGFGYVNKSGHTVDPDVLQKLQFKVVPVNRCFEYGKRYMMNHSSTEQNADTVANEMKKKERALICGISTREYAGLFVGDTANPLMCRSRSQPWVLYGMSIAGIGKRTQHVIFASVPEISGWLKKIVSKYDHEFQSEFTTVSATQAAPSGYRHPAVEVRVNGTRQAKWNLRVLVGDER